MYETAMVEHLTSPCSDHCPLLLRTAPVETRRSGERILRYEIMWEREDSLAEVVEEAWTATRPGANLGSVARALEEVMGLLHEWSRSKFGSVRKKLKELRNKLCNAQCRGAANHSRVAEGTRPSPEGVYLGVS